MDKTTLDKIVKQISRLAAREEYAAEVNEAATLAIVVLGATRGADRQLSAVIRSMLENKDWYGLAGASRAVVALYNEGALESPRLEIAHEIEADLLELAKREVSAAESTKSPTQIKIHLGIAAFLAGAALEDALRRLCDANGIAYDPSKATISKLQSALYQPAAGIEVIDVSDTKAITTWGDARNKADHGKLGELTPGEVLSMVIGVAAFLNKRLP